MQCPVLQIKALFAIDEWLCFFLRKVGYVHLTRIGDVQLGS
jgi:hypothetical protein